MTKRQAAYTGINRYADTANALHPALASEGGILCGLCVRLSVCPLSPSIRS
jgi:hypothetical protein